MSGFYRNKKKKRFKNKIANIYILSAVCLLLPMGITAFVVGHTGSVQKSFDLLLGNEEVTEAPYDFEVKTNENPEGEEDGDVSLSAKDASNLTSGNENAEVSSAGDADITDETDVEEETVISGKAYHAPGRIEGTNGKTVYITFDDGPSMMTDEILDILDEKGVKATFFVVNTSDMFYDSMKRIVDEGHTIAMHSYTHDYSTVYADLNSFERDVNMIHDLIYDVTGVDAKYYRFPGGSSNQVSQVPMEECAEYLSDMGYVYFDWNAMNDDAEVKNLSADELNRRALGYIANNPGDTVLLLHDLETHQATVEALPELIDTLLAEGYGIAAIDDDTPLVQHVSFDGE